MTVISYKRYKVLIYALFSQIISMDKINIFDYIKSLESFIEQKSNNQESVCESEYYEQCKFESVIGYINNLHECIKKNANNNSSPPKEQLEYLKSVHKSVFSTFEKRHGQLLTNTNRDELDDRLLALKLPFPPTTSPGESSPEVASTSNSRKRKKKKQQQTNRKRSKEPTNILQWLQDSIVTDLQTDLELDPLPDPESEVSLDFLVDKINKFIKILKSRSIQNKSNKFVFAKWLHLCHSKYISEINNNWLQWIMSKTSLAKRQINRYLAFYELVNMYPRLLQTSISLSKLVDYKTKILETLQSEHGDYWKKV